MESVIDEDLPAAEGVDPDVAVDQLLDHEAPAVA